MYQMMDLLSEDSLKLARPVWLLSKTDSPIGVIFRPIHSHIRQQKLTHISGEEKDSINVGRLLDMREDVTITMMYDEQRTGTGGWRVWNCRHVELQMMCRCHDRKRALVRHGRGNSR